MPPYPDNRIRSGLPLENNQVVRPPESMSEKKDDEETQPAE
jgi:hypothetical protein